MACVPAARCAEPTVAPPLLVSEKDTDPVGLADPVPPTVAVKVYIPTAPDDTRDVVLGAIPLTVTVETVELLAASVVVPTKWA